MNKKNYFLPIILALICNAAAIIIYTFDKKFIYSNLILAFWLGGIAIIFLWAVITSKKKQLFRVGTKKKVFWFLIILTFLSIFLRFYQLNQIPLLNGDETRDTGIWPEAFLKGKINDYFGYGVYGISNLFFIISSIPHLFLGHSIWAIRFFAALFGVFSIIVTYFLTKENFDQKTGKIAALLLTVYHVHLHFSRSEFINIFDSFWAPLIMLFLFRSLAKKTKKEFDSNLFLGLTMGIAFHFYQGIRATILLAFIYFLLANIKYIRHYFQFFITKVFYFLFGLFLGIGPSAVIFITDTQKIFNTGTAGKPLPLKLGIGNFISIFPLRLFHSLGSLIYYPIEFHYHYGGPFIQFPFNCLFLLGLLFLFKNIKKKKCHLLLLWIIFVFIFNSAILKDLNFTHRLLSATPALMIILAIGIIAFANFFKKKFLINLTVVLAVSFFIFSNLQLYFGKSIWKKAIDTNTKVATTAGYYISSFSGERKFYFLNSSRMGWQSIPTWQYLAPHHQVENLSEEKFEKIPLSRKWQKEKTTFIILPERRKDLTLLRKHFPNGLFEKHYYDHELLFYSYKLN